MVTHRNHSSSEKIRFTDSSPAELVKRLREESGKGIWICGGASIVRQLINEDMIDCYHITVIPTILGGGVRLFNNGGHEIRLCLLRTQSYNGMTELVYTRNATERER